MQQPLNKYLFPLDGKKMNVVETAGTGVVNEETLFEFTQDEKGVYAQYAGGGIKEGSLMGTICGDKLWFDYIQRDVLGNIDSGRSICEIIYLPSGKIRLIEHFEWKSRPGIRGKNIFEEV